MLIAQKIKFSIKDFFIFCAVAGKNALYIKNFLLW